MSQPYSVRVGYKRLQLIVLQFVCFNAVHASEQIPYGFNYQQAQHHTPRHVQGPDWGSPDTVLHSSSVEDFESQPLRRAPAFFADQGGAFEVVEAGKAWHGVDPAAGSIRTCAIRVL